MESAAPASMPRSSQRVLIFGTPSMPSEVSINYVAASPPAHTKTKGTILLIHGYPQTSYQFRHVIGPLAAAGYAVVAPDYRGAGHSSKPRNGYEKSQMAADLHALLTKHLGVTSKVHVVGHDIGGMVAHAYATRFGGDTASVAFGECPLPGTKVYEHFCREDAGVWHFHFHWQADLPELLTYGREREYLQHFYDRLSANAAAITQADVDHYAGLFAKAGGMRAGFDVYRAFHKDAEENKEWLRANGKCAVPCMSLNGNKSFLAGIAEEQSIEMYETTETATVADAGHWCAEENPEDFVRQVLRWVAKHDSSES